MKDMKNQGNILIILLLIVAAASAFGYFYVKNNNHGFAGIIRPVSQIVQNGEISKAQAQNSQMQISEIEITKSGFKPSFIKIKRGSQVRWTNNDNAHHQIASDPDLGHANWVEIDGIELAPSESFTFTFEKVGTHSYHDYFNPIKFRGIVIVE